MSIRAALDFLEDQPIGDFLFRYSSKVNIIYFKNTNFLNITWKIYLNSYKHI